MSYDFANWCRIWALRETRGYARAGMDFVFVRWRELVCGFASNLLSTCVILIRREASLLLDELPGGSLLQAVVFFMVWS